MRWEVNRAKLREVAAFRRSPPWRPETVVRPALARVGAPSFAIRVDSRGFRASVIVLRVGGGGPGLFGCGLGCEPTFFHRCLVFCPVVPRRRGAVRITKLENGNEVCLMYSRIPAGLATLGTAMSGVKRC